jgi:hypothetical protein
MRWGNYQDSRECFGIEVRVRVPVELFDSIRSLQSVASTK